MELTSLANATQTSVKQQFKSGAYEMARLDVTSAFLYNSQNHAAARLSMTNEEG
jgi:hypothetical protein